MPGPLALGLYGLGSKLLGGYLSARSERSRMRRQRIAQEAALAPLEAEIPKLRANLATSRFGLSGSENAIRQGVVEGTLADLGQRGLLQSSVAAPSVARAVAPIELQHQQNVQGQE